MGIRGQGDYGEAIAGIDRDLLGDVVAAAIRREVNGQIRDVERAVIRLTHEHRQTRGEVAGLKRTLDEKASRWDAAADVAERISSTGRLIASRAARVLLIVLAGAIGLDAIIRILL